MKTEITIDSDKDALYKQRKKWAENIQANRDVWSKGLSVWSLDHLFTGFPAVVVGAGPSLKKNASLLSECRFPIFCTDRAVQMIDVTPQFVVVADDSDAVADFFTGCNTRKMILLCPVHVSPDVLKHKWAKIRWYGVRDVSDGFVGVAKAIKEINPDMNFIDQCYIVGNAAYIFAKYAGCEPITFIGNDLAYEEKPDGTHIEVEWEEKIYYTDPAYMAAFQWLSKFMIKQNFEAYNSSEAGVMFTPRIKDIKFSEFVEKFQPQRAFSSKLNQV